MKIKPIKVLINEKPVTFWSSPVTMNDLLAHTDIEMSQEWKDNEGQETFSVQNGMSFNLKKN